MRILVIGFLFFTLQSAGTEAQSATTATAFNSPRLISFKREAEKAIGKPIRITYAGNLGSEAGKTECEDNPVTMEIEPKFDRKTQELVIAHELGHVMLCSRHMNIKLTDYMPTTPPNLTPILGALAAAIGSCYYDPLANAEAEKRGFAVTTLEKVVVAYIKTANKDDLKHSIEQYGGYARDLSALSVYCIEIRAGKRMPEVEAYFSGDPDIVSKLESLRSNMGTPSCNDELSCYYLSKRLRDQFSWKSILRMANPTTGAPE